ncbi:MAG TPA: MFS transporter, partial [Terriglobales bacterium]|nr:MFS transporter [Terriglobales bacterium]
MHKTHDRQGFAAYYMLMILLAANVLSAVDRFLIALLAQPMKADLNLSDTQIALLQGLAFVVFYSTLAVPVGRLADSFKRKHIIAASVSIWSLATMAFGIMRSFPALFICRIGVGCGEATLNPVSYSLLSDAFPRARLAGAIGIFTSGNFIGGGLALLLGGALIDCLSHQPPVLLPFLGHLHSWQVCFLLLGSPGLVVSMLMFSVHEPSRTGTLTRSDKRILIKDVSKFVVANGRFFLCLTGGTALLALYGYGSQAWLPSYFVRSHGWSLSEVGSRFGLVTLLFAPAGALLAGSIARKSEQAGHTDAYMRVSGIGVLLLIPTSVGAYLAPNGWVALTLVALGSALSSLPYPLIAAMLQRIAPNQMRAQISAMHLLVVNLVSLVLGPLSVALLTDHMFHSEAML